ncbi:MAG: DNA cytosine methyltransferase [Candidatus Obscuribacterales bacterium]|nr:DNA cytosine methyltransferase [Candidatus Obscuribacterales bacterium]
MPLPTESIKTDTLKACEFFSGIGAFSEALKLSSLGEKVTVVQAFDQSEWANQVYFLNHDLAPDKRSLATIKPATIAKDASLWWLSPPCTPFSRRGQKKDIEDERARPFLHLLDMLPLLRPTYVFIENVLGLEGSRMEDHLRLLFAENQYAFDFIKICPSQFGVPMLRPRLFYLAIDSLADAPSSKRLMEGALFLPLDHFRVEEEKSRLSAYLLPEPEAQLSPRLSQKEFERYESVLNVLDGKDQKARAICFTSGYFRCRKAAGSMLRDEIGVRFFHPREILALLGFSPRFAFPEALSDKVVYKLLGNSVDVRSIEYLLQSLFGRDYASVL